MNMEAALDTFVAEVADLHAQKHAAYGDSWKKRGELFSILPNIARKVDRLGAETETSDENRTDTAIDFTVYCAKYILWIEGREDSPALVKDYLQGGSDTFDWSQVDMANDAPITRIIVKLFNNLLDQIESGSIDRSRKADAVENLFQLGFDLAFIRWCQDAERVGQERAAAWGDPK